jgi:basic membrane protein A
MVGFAFAGGGGDKSAGAAKASGPVDKQTGKPLKAGFVYIGDIHDEGYTQAHDAGRLAVEKMGVPTAYVENVPENPSATEAACRNLIDQGCNLIYTTSFGFMDGTENMAKEFPDIKFAHCSGYKNTEPNMARYFGKVYQARYLAGIAAGYKTKTNKIAYIAAFPIPECIRGLNAFTLGVLSVNPAATVEVAWTGTWYDPAVEKQAALSLLDKGCDITEQHQDSTACQIAAQERGAFCIGYNVPTPNAAPQAYLTAPLFHWTVYYTANVQKAIDGTWTNEAYWEGLSNGQVGLDKLTALNDPRAQPEIDKVTAQIKSGAFDPFQGPIADQSGAVKVAAGSKMTDDEIWNIDWLVKGVIGSVK